jgi:hypothetical protein
MTDQKLRNLVTEAVQLDRKIAELEGSLKLLKADLVNEARSREEEHVATDGGGSSWVAQGCDGCVCRVTFPGPTLRGSISGEGKTIEKIRALAGTAFNRLFTPSIAFRPIGEFRFVAQAELGKGAGKLIKAVTSETSPKVSFETTEKV